MTVSKFLTVVSVLIGSFGAGMFFGPGLASPVRDAAEQHQDLVGKPFPDVEVRRFPSEDSARLTSGGQGTLFILAVSPRCSLPLGEVESWAQEVGRVTGTPLRVVLVDADDEEAKRMATALSVEIFRTSTSVMESAGIQAVPVLLSVDSSGTIMRVATGSTEITATLAGESGE
jgi:hypothetical protein